MQKGLFIPKSLSPFAVNRWVRRTEKSFTLNQKRTYDMVTGLEIEISSRIDYWGRKSNCHFFGSSCDFDSYLLHRNRCSLAQNDFAYGNSCRSEVEEKKRWGSDVKLFNCLLFYRLKVTCRKGVILEEPWCLFYPKGGFNFNFLFDRFSLLLRGVIRQ